MSEYHRPVLSAEAREGLRIEAGKKYIDATIGGGGHAWDIRAGGGVVLGIDTDIEAITHVMKRLKEEQEPLVRETYIPQCKSKVFEYQSITLVQGNFRNIQVIAGATGFTNISGAIFDLGVSSHQIDASYRGFSYRFADAPLDLRLNQEEGEMASSLVQRLSEEELYEIFSRYGEEELARPIAHALVGSRSLNPIQTVGQFMHEVEPIAKRSREPGRVYARLFQALRMAINDELGSLREAFVGVNRILVSRARLVVISFHSLEDRVVKQYMKKPEWRVITKRPLVASSLEVATNPRARSAKLRIAEKI